MSMIGRVLVAASAVCLVLMVAACGRQVESRSGNTAGFTPSREWDCLPLIRTSDYAVYPGDNLVVWASASRCGDLYSHSISYRLRLEAGASRIQDLGTVRVARNGSFKTAVQVPDWRPSMGSRVNVSLTVRFPFSVPCDDTGTGGSSCASYGDGFYIYASGDKRAANPRAMPTVSPPTATTSP